MSENEFNKLFNQYFGGEKKPNKDIDPSGKMGKMIDFMSKLNKEGISGLNAEEAELGDPDSVRTFKQDGVTFIESSWNTKYGTIIRLETKDDIEFSDDYFNRNNIPTGRDEPVEMSLEEELELASKRENYELCAKLRDEIKAKNEEKIAGENKNNKGIPKKENKDKASENLDNKGFPEDEDWNF